MVKPCHGLCRVSHEIKIIKKSTFLGREIDVYGTADEPFFKAKDVAEWLELSNVSDMVSRIEVEEVAKFNLGSLQGETWFLTEDGLYEILMQSRKPIAKQFKKGVKTILKEIRKTGTFSSSVSQQQASLNEQIQANLTFADWTIKTLNLNDASKIAWAKKISDKFGLAAELPSVVNAGTEHPVTHAATDLLKEHQVGISAQAFNRMLEIKGVVKQATRPGKQGKVHKWYVITPAFDKYGQNQQDPKFQRQTQIRWYDSSFEELLTIVGLNRQQTIILK